LLDHTQDKVALVDRSGTFRYVNDAAERILGFAPDELERENAFEYVHPEDREEVRERFEEVVTGSRGYTADTATYRHRTADAGWVWLESRLSNLTDAELDGYVVSSRDVTDRVAVERDRRETEDRLHELAETTDDVLWMFSADWSELLFCNPAYEAVYGKSVERLEGNPGSFLECIHPEDVPAVEDAMERLSAGEAVDVEYRANPDRDYGVWVWAQGQPILEDGEVVRIAGFARDVTDRRRRERQLAVMDNLLRHNVRSRTNEAVGHAELIEDRAEVDVEDHVEVIRRAGNELVESAEKQRAIVDLLTKPAHPTSVDLAAEVAAAVDDVGDRFPGATVTAELPESLVVSSLEEVQCAVVELLENAIRHGADGTPDVAVVLRATEEGGELLVRDDCPPIPEFDRRVLLGDHEDDAVYHSSGCGLWLVYWVVDLSGGRVEVEAGDGGNEVRVAFPRPTA
jgi:PAS domain S-box-containing protein